MRALICSIALSIALTGSTFAQVTFRGLGYLPGGSGDSWARGISADGSVVVGESKNASGGYEAFRWTPSGGMVGLGSMPGGDNAQSSAYGLSADGSVVVGHAGGRAFRWTAATGMTAMEHLTGTRAGANAVSADGTIAVGYRDTSVTNFQAARWSPGFQSLGYLTGGTAYSDAYDISDDGRTIVGRANSAQGGEAYRWTVTTGMVSLGPQPDGAHNSTAYGISADGTTIVGIFSGANEAFRWTEATGMIGLGFLDPAHPRSDAFGLSADGSVIIGTSASAPSIDEAFIWDQANGMRNLKTLLVAGGADLTGWNNLHAWDISADGRTIVGIGHRPTPTGQTVREAWVATIPEPETLSLLLMTVLACGLYRCSARLSSSRD